MYEGDHVVEADSSIGCTYTCISNVCMRMFGLRERNQLFGSAARLFAILVMFFRLVYEF